MKSLNVLKAFSETLPFYSTKEDKEIATKKYLSKNFKLVAQYKIAACTFRII